MAEITNTYGSDLLSITYTTSVPLASNLPLANQNIVFAVDNTPEIKLVASTFYVNLSTSTPSTIINFGSDIVSGRIFVSSTKYSGVLTDGTMGGIINFGIDEQKPMNLSKNPTFVGASLDSGGASALVAYQFWS